MKVWTDATERALDQASKYGVLGTAHTRAVLRVRWQAQYRAEREAYLETLPELSRTGRLIWIHARRNDR